MEIDKVQEIYVRQVYEKLARHESYIYDQASTSSTVPDRNKPWPAVQEFINKMPKGSVIIDAGQNFIFKTTNFFIKFTGCGPIKQEIPDCFRIGFDTCSEGLILSKYSPYHDIVIADGLNLPFRYSSIKIFNKFYDLFCNKFRNNCADAVLCISVLHHIPSYNRRLQFLKNLARVMSPTEFRQMMIYVWAKEQPSAKFPGQDILVPWNLHEIPKNSQLIYKFK